MTTNQVALVTGGNRGLGLETCRQLAARDFNVLLGSRNLDAGNTAAASIGRERVRAVQLDVCTAADVEALAAKIEQEYGRLDVLVNNAGIMIDSADGRSSSIRDADIDVIEQTLITNTLAPIRLINALLPLLEKADDARIVNVSSGMGQLADMGANFPAYRLSKCALNAVTRIFAAELDSTRININSVCPGWVRTDMGGANADLAVAEGVDTLVWLATAADVGSGGYFRQRQSIAW